jgi:hypothetical protein
MSRVEIEDFQTFFRKVAEICSITIYNMDNGKDPNDEGWDVMEEVHKIFLDGKVVLYKTVLDEPDRVATQGGLFTDNVAEVK